MCEKTVAQIAFHCAGNKGCNRFPTPQNGSAYKQYGKQNEQCCLQLCQRFFEQKSSVDNMRDQASLYHNTARRQETQHPHHSHINVHRFYIVKKALIYPHCVYLPILTRSGTC